MPGPAPTPRQQQMWEKCRRQFIETFGPVEHVDVYGTAVLEALAETDPDPETLPDLLADVESLTTLDIAVLRQHETLGKTLVELVETEGIILLHSRCEEATRFKPPEEHLGDAGAELLDEPFLVIDVE